MKARLFVSLATAVLVSIPIIIVSLSPAGLTRLSATSAFTEDNPIYQEDRLQFKIAKEQGNIVNQFIYNRRSTPIKIFINNYLYHYKLDWMFLGGPYERFKVPGLGLFYFWEAPLIAIGFFVLSLSQIDRKQKFALLLLFLISPIPAALTTQAPHAMRIFTLLPVFVLFSGLGLLWVVRLVKPYVMICIALGVAMSVFYLYQQYFYVFPKTQSNWFQYALFKTIPYVLEHQNDYSQVVFSNQGNLLQSYMFFLYLSSYDPLEYKRMGGTKSGGFAEVHHIGKFEFRSISQDEQYEKDVLYISDMKDYPQTVPLRKIFSNLNGEEAIKISSL